MVQICGGFSLTFLFFARLFVLELCEGGELFDRIVAKKHFSEMESAEIMKQILHAVAYCHSVQITHRCPPSQCNDVFCA